jgi:hypothetical protein
MELRLPRLLITADLPDTLTGLGGISLLERLRRSARILGFRDPHLSRCADLIVDLTRSEADLAD